VTGFDFNDLNKGIVDELRANRGVLGGMFATRFPPVTRV
jgi:hypothetical protein